MQHAPKNPALAAIPRGLMAALDDRKRALLREGRRLLDLGIGDPLEPTPAFLRDAFLAAAGPVSQYPSPYGTPALRAAAAGYLARRFGVTVDPEAQVLACAGAKEAIFHLPLAFAGAPGRTQVVIPDPAYPSYEAGARLAGLEVVRAPLRPERRFLLEPEDLGEDVLRRTLVLWVNYPHNPTGAEADRAYYRRLGEAAKRYGFIVGSDEVYTDLYFGAERPPSMLEVQVENVVAVYSCSKRSGMTGYRSGFMAGDPDLMAALRQLRAHPGCASAEPVAAAAALAWADDAHAAERSAVFRAKRDVFRAFFRRHGLEVAPGESTIYLWVKVPGGDDGAYALRLLEGGIVVAPGASFGPAGAGWVRVALVPTLPQCEEAVRAWERVR
ncbi:MAG: succinyldiaminopimelate transaminase [Anaeromyxobacter sp.]